jgi:hypothetical protein
MLDDFGSDELEQLHRSDELERLPWKLKFM